MGHDDQGGPADRVVVAGHQLLRTVSIGHVVLGEGPRDRGEHARPVGDVEGDVVAGDGLADGQHRQVRVRRLARPATTDDAVAGHRDEVAEHGAGRRVAARARP